MSSGQKTTLATITLPTTEPPQCTPGAPDLPLERERAFSMFSFPIRGKQVFGSQGAEAFIMLIKCHKGIECYMTYGGDRHSPGLRGRS